MIIPEHQKESIDTIIDKDFIQLHSKNVKQYNPVLSKFVVMSKNQVYILKNIYLKVTEVTVYLTYFQMIMCLLKVEGRNL